jgi:hypothetical protein
VLSLEGASHDEQADDSRTANDPLRYQRVGELDPPLVVLMRSPAWVLQLQRTARAWGYRDFSWVETPDEYAEAVADHIARVEVRAACGT